MGKLKDNNRGFGGLELVMAIVIVILLCAVGWYVYKDHNKTTPVKVVTITKTVTKTTPATSNTPSNYSILSPAIVNSKTAECSTPITIANDGTSGPETCSNGELNTTEWNYLAKTTTLSIMTLGYSATEQQVTNALCNDTDGTVRDGATLPIEGVALDMSSLYYGWDSSYALINIPGLSCLQ